MKNLILALVLAIAAWYGWGKYEAHVKAERAAEFKARSQPAKPVLPSNTPGSGVSFFTCDGRNTCIQMTSCEEAKFFVKNCPGMSSEANREGTSCEKQWCK